MFTKNTKEELEFPGMHLKSEGNESKSFKGLDIALDEDSTFEIKEDNPDIKEYNDAGQFPFNMEGESLW